MKVKKIFKKNIKKYNRKIETNIRSKDNKDLYRKTNFIQIKIVRIYTFLRGLPQGLLGTPGSTFGCCFAVFSLNRALLRGGSSGAAGLSFECPKEESLI